MRWKASCAPSKPGFQRLDHQCESVQTNPQKRRSLRPGTSQIAGQGRGAHERNVGGAIAEAVIGGILGHHIGGGVGKDVTTAGGAVAGGMIGSNVGRNSGTVMQDRDVRKCEATPAPLPPTGTLPTTSTVSSTDCG